MENDPELQAMNVVYNSLSGLESDEARQRVIQWAIGRFSLSKAKLPKKDLGFEDEETIPPKGGNIKSFNSVADIFARANATKDKDKALVVGAFLQEKYEKEDLSGSEINKELKHLGHGLNNVTDAINQLKSKKPKLMIQTRKEGTTQQARKKYKVTTEGIKEVNALLNVTED